MTIHNQDNFNDYLHHFKWHDLKGRYWLAPGLNAQADEHLLVFIYGHHSSLERNQGVLQHFRQVGRVLAIDLPGFGGMDSLYKMGLKPNIDNFAHYLNHLLRLHTKENQKFSLIGFCFGFLITTRLLQIYPSWQERIRLNLSVVGFLSGKRFSFSKNRRRWYLIGAKFISMRLGAFIFRYLVLNRWILRRFYAKTSLAKTKFMNKNPAQRRELMEVEIDLWHRNDVRTWAFTSIVMLNCDLIGETVNTDVYHLATDYDQYFNHNNNIEDLKKVYNQVTFIKMNLSNHAPTIIISPKEAQEMIPQEMLDVFEKEIE